METTTPMGSMVIIIMAALAQMEHEINRERGTDSIKERKVAGKEPRRLASTGNG